jgi:hypothetical protein
MFSPTGFGSLNYYYEAIQVDVFANGCYNITSNSTIDTDGYIYEDNFNLMIPSGNLLSRNDRSFRSNQFELLTRLQVNSNYILVVTTNEPNVTGAFSLIVNGPNMVRFNRTSEYFYLVFLKNEQESIIHRICV